MAAIVAKMEAANFMVWKQITKCVKIFSTNEICQQASERKKFAENTGSRTLQVLHNCTRNSMEFDSHASSGTRNRRGKPKKKPCHGVENHFMENWPGGAGTKMSEVGDSQWPLIRPYCSHVGHSKNLEFR